MLLLNIILLPVFVGFVAANQNERWYARMTGTILCNGQPVDTRMEVMEAGDDESEHDHMAVVMIKSGIFDFVATKSEEPSVWFWIVGYPDFFLRIHYQCGKCPDHQDLSSVGNGDQYVNPWEALEKPYKYGVIELSECRKYG